MGLLDIFNKEKRKRRSLEKAIARLTNAYQQSPERMRGADILLELAEDEALREEAYYGLLKRFTIRASNGVEDEEEKEHVFAMALGLGRAIIPAIERFIRNQDQIYYPLRLLSELLDEEEVVRIVGAALEYFGPDYMRNPERKLHLIQHMGEIQHESAVEILKPFLWDHDPGVRFQTVNALLQQDDEAAREPLLDRITDEEEETSIRLRNRVIEAIAEAGWTVKGYRKKVEEMLPKGYYLDKAGNIKKKGG